jgi:hypothetical protein
MELVKPNCLEAFKERVTNAMRTSGNIIKTVGKGLSVLVPDIGDILNFDEMPKDAWVAVVNDFDLAMTVELYKRDITNIVLISTIQANKDIPQTTRDTLDFYFFKMLYDEKFKSYLVNDQLPWKTILHIADDQDIPCLTSKGKVTWKKGMNFNFSKGDISMLENNTFDAVITNMPFSIGNEIITAMCNCSTFHFKDGNFVSVLPISKYKKGDLYKRIVPGSIRNNTRAREVSEFDGADTYPVICTLRKNPVNIAPDFKTFEQRYCVNREENLGKKFFEEQDRRIAAEENGTRPRAFVEQIYMVYEKDLPKINSATTFSSSIWTPNIAHGWGAQEIKEKDGSFKNNDYCDWNIRCVNKSYNEVFSMTSSNNINQTVTIMNTPEGKRHLTNWIHSAEMSGKYRHCGLFTILLRWMNKTTGCKYDYILPRVDWDSKDWTDEEILRDYGYTEEEIKTVLHYNYDIIPPSWKKAQEVKDETNSEN